MSARKVLLSVVVPCFNEEAVLELTHRRLLESLGADASFDLEIVYVNDGSRDRTEDMLFDLADRDARTAAAWTSGSCCSETRSELPRTWARNIAWMIRLISSPIRP